jgi:hypothetical protein
MKVHGSTFHVIASPDFGKGRSAAEMRLTLLVRRFAEGDGGDVGELDQRKEERGFQGVRDSPLMAVLARSFLSQLSVTDSAIWRNACLSFGRNRDCQLFTSVCKWVDNNLSASNCS